jgi:hypothetical protein
MDKTGLSRRISFLRPWWWVIHSVGIAFVYTMGSLLWR